MGRGKDLTEEEKSIIIKGISTGNIPGAIAKEIGRHVATVKRFVQSPSKTKPQRYRGVLKSVTKRDFSRLRRSLTKNACGNQCKDSWRSWSSERSENHSQSSSQDSCSYQESPLTPKHNRLRMEWSKRYMKKPPLTPKHNRLRMEWSKRYMKTDMNLVLLTDESRATLDDPDGWAKGWVYNGDTCHARMRRQQGGGGVMLWTGIIGDELVGFFRVPDGLKLTAATYFEFLKKALEPWLDDFPLSRLKTIVFMHDNATLHAAKATTAFLKSLGFVNESRMTWPPNSPD